MANEIRDQANEALRDFETAGNPASGTHKPRKSAIRGVFHTVDDKVEDHEARLTSAEEELATEMSARQAADAALGGRIDSVENIAFANTNVYSSVSEGRAAVPDGEQFQVLVGDEIVRYRRDSASTQTEIVRYPTISTFGEVKGQATLSTNWNTLARSGWYRGSSSSGNTVGAPATTANLFLAHVEGLGGRATQTTYSVAAGFPSWKRVRDSNGNWSDWVEFVHTGNIDGLLDESLARQESLVSPGRVPQRVPKRFSDYTNNVEGAGIANRPALTGWTAFNASEGASARTTVPGSIARRRVASLGPSADVPRFRVSAITGMVGSGHIGRVRVGCAWFANNGNYLSSTDRFDYPQYGGGWEYFTAGRPGSGADLIAPSDAHYFAPYVIAESNAADVPGTAILVHFLDVSQVEAGSGGGGADLSDLPFSSHEADDQAPWNNLGSVWVKRPLGSIYRTPVNTLFPSHAEVYAYLDNLMNDFSDYVSKQVLGQDVSGNDVVLYRFKPADYVRVSAASYPQSQVDRPKIIISGSTHGDEKHAAVANIAFFTSLCREWRQRAPFDRLRWGVDFLFVPLVKPSGFDANTRKNAAGVDINRNFPPQWSEAGGTDPADNTYRGPSAGSEPETQILMDLMDDHLDAICLIDHHRMARFNGDTERLIWIGAEGPGPFGMARSAVERSVADVRRHLTFIPDTNSESGSLTVHYPATVSLQAHTVGINAYLMETPDGIGGTEVDVREHAERCLINLVMTNYERALRLREDAE